MSSEFFVQIREQWTPARFIFTIVLVLGIAGAIIFMLDPKKQLVQYRNQQRRADANELIAALNQYAAEHEGKIPTEISEEAKEICRSGTAQCGNRVNFSFLTESKKYLKKIPVDPQSEDGSGSGYTIMKLGNGRITITAPLAEDNAKITVTR